MVAEESDFGAILGPAQQGDEAAMAALYRLVNPGLMRFLRSSEPRYAEDVASETWISVATNLHRFEGPLGAFRAWVFTIARRRLIDARRHAARRPMDLYAPDDLGGVADTDQTDHAVIDRIGAAEAVAFIRENLTPEQAEVVLLRVMSGLTVEETAAILERPSTWVRVTTHRALRRLGDRLGTRFGVTQ